MAKPICKIILGTEGFNRDEVDRIAIKLEDTFKEDYFLFTIFDKERPLKETEIEVYNVENATESIEAVDIVIKEINNEAK